MEDSIISLFDAPFLIPAYAKQLLLAACFGLLLGFERGMRQKAASLRTFAMICMGSCLFTILSVEAAGSHGGGPYDVTRVSAGIVTGVGFLGGGVIFKTTNRIAGITTGAMIWMAAAIGMACGFNHIHAAVWAGLVYLFIVVVGPIMHAPLALMRKERNDDDSGG